MSKVNQARALLKTYVPGSASIAYAQDEPYTPITGPQLHKSGEMKHEVRVRFVRGNLCFGDHPGLDRSVLGLAGAPDVPLLQPMAQKHLTPNWLRFA